MPAVTPGPVEFDRGKNDEGEPRQNRRLQRKAADGKPTVGRGDLRLEKDHRQEQPAHADTEPRQARFGEEIGPHVHAHDQHPESDERGGRLPGEEVGARTAVALGGDEPRSRGQESQTHPDLEDGGAEQKAVEALPYGHVVASSRARAAKTSPRCS